MSVKDIRPIKTELRSHYRNLRDKMSKDEKQEKDDKILKRMISLWQYKHSKLIMTYVSTDIEVDTHALVSQALKDGKKVAVPRCIPNTRNIEFYYINSISELSKGTFGVLEPSPNNQKKVTNYSKSLCIVPALCYDWKGYRLGYGGGYYDRFLSKYDPSLDAHNQGNIKGRHLKYRKDLLNTKNKPTDRHLIGITYSFCVKRRLPRGKYDRPVSLLVTDEFIRKTNR